MSPEEMYSLIRDALNEEANIRMNRVRRISSSREEVFIPFQHRQDQSHADSNWNSGFVAGSLIASTVAIIVAASIILAAIKGEE